MAALTLLTWISSGVVIATYAWFASGRGKGASFHIANALTGPVVIAYGISLGAWATLPLPILFTAVGIWGWIVDE